MYEHNVRVDETVPVRIMLGPRFKLNEFVI